MAEYRGVAFAGFGGVGKSTATTFACTYLGATRVHVKDVLGECISPILLRLGVGLDDLHDYIYGEKKNDPLPLAPGISAVKLLQAQGNGFLKECGDLMLAQRLALDAVHPAVPVVNESLRYPREAEYLQKRGIAIIGITRSGYTGKKTLDGQLHESEMFADQIPCDRTVVNDGDVSLLHARVQAALYSLGFRPHTTTPNVGHVVMINGKPRSGKDDFCKYAVSYAHERYGVKFDSFSAIDPVRHLLSSAGIDTSRKSPEDRRLLSVVGEELEAHSSFKTRSTLNAAREVAEQGLAFIHVREPHTMANIVNLVDLLGIRCSVSYLWMSRPGYKHKAPSNASDDISEDDVEYGWSIANSGTLADLQFAAADFVDRVLSGHLSGHINSEGRARW